MIKNNFFVLKNLKNVVFIGEHESLKELVKINNENKLKSIIVTSPVQKKKFKKVLISKFLQSWIISSLLILMNWLMLIKLYLFSIKSRWIFKKKIIKHLFKNNLINYHPAETPILQRRGNSFMENNEWR